MKNKSPVLAALPFWIAAALVTAYGAYAIYGTLAGVLSASSTDVFIVLLGIVLLALGFIRYHRQKQARKPAREISQPAAVSESSDIEIQPQAPAPLQKSVTVPKRIGNEILLYHYDHVAFMPVDGAKDIISDYADKDGTELTCEAREEQIILLLGDKEIGTLNSHVQIVSDWLSRGDTLKIWLERFIRDSASYVFLAFYRDEAARLSYREQSVVALTHFAEEGAQAGILGLDVGEKLHFDEDDPDVVWISDGVDSIGRLPQAAADRYFSEGAAAVFIERIDYDVDNDMYLPYVRIYW